MTNMWIKKSQQRRYTLAISKNAIFRLGPMSVKIISKDHIKKIFVLNLGDAIEIDLIELSNIINEIKSKDLSYYGRISSSLNKKESTHTLLRSIKKMEIDFDYKELILTIHCS